MLWACLGLWLPERAPANVALAEVLVGCCLFDEQFDLCWDIQSFIVREVPTSELISNSVNNLNSFLVQGLWFDQPISNERMNRFWHCGPRFLMGWFPKFHAIQNFY